MLFRSHALISHGADGRRGRPVRKLINRIVVLLLGPGVKLKGPGIEGRLVYPNESAVLFDQLLKEFSEDYSVFFDIWAVSVLGHSLTSDIRHVQFLFEN